MQQMPKEGRAFCMVDKNWKQVMAKAVVSNIIPSLLTSLGSFIFLNLKHMSEN